MGWQPSTVTAECLGLNKIPEGRRLTSDDARRVAPELIQAIAAFREKTLMNPNPKER